MRNRALAVFAAVMLCGLWVATAACAQTKPVDGSVAAGRALALQACTSCHVVTADQPYKPILKRTPSPPDFKDIANKPNVTAGSLRRYLASLPAIPKGSEMANPDLTEEELRDVTAFIMTLGDKSSASSR